MKFLLSPRLILPLTVLVGVLVMGMRMADMYSTLESGRLSIHAAQAADTAPATAPAPAAAPAPPKPDEAPADSASGGGSGLGAPPDADSSPAELDVLKQLSDRREQLEKRSRDLDTHEALIKVTEQRVDQKIKEMETLRLQLQGMVNQANEAQQAQVENLVKIYETMKPEDAAKIFEKLDMPVLLGVIKQMKPKSTAPIMAKMAPEKAKDITDALTKQDQLPQVK